MIKRALDAGAHGILTPMCHSAVSIFFFFLFNQFDKRYIYIYIFKEEEEEETNIK